MKNLQSILNEAFNNNIELSGNVSVEDLKDQIFDAMTDACIDVADEIHAAHLDSEDGDLEPIIDKMFDGVE